MQWTGQNLGPSDPRQASDVNGACFRRWVLFAPSEGFERGSADRLAGTAGQPGIEPPTYTTYTPVVISMHVGSIFYKQSSSLIHFKELFEVKTLIARWCVCTDPLTRRSDVFTPILIHPSIFSSLTYIAWTSYGRHVRSVPPIIWCHFKSPPHSWIAIHPCTFTYVLWTLSDWEPCVHASILSLFQT